VTAVQDQFRVLVPDDIIVPMEHTDAVAVVDLVVVDDPVRVTAPGLDVLKGALAIGSADLVRSYCEMWTRFLTAAYAGTRRGEP
jgi:hypothetical protein